MSSQRLSAVSRLRQLPAVFHVQDLATVFCWSPVRASSLLTRWKRQTLVTPAGIGVWLNLIVDGEGPNTRLYQAIARMFPAAVVIGATVLHDSGWTTQIPHRAAIAVPGRCAAVRLPNIEVCTRPRPWFRKIEPFLVQDEYPIPSLSPAAALADALCYTPGWRPDPDDIELEDIDDIKAFRSAWRTIKKQRQTWPAEWKAHFREKKLLSKAVFGRLNQAELRG